MLRNLKNTLLFLVVLSLSGTGFYSVPSSSFPSDSSCLAPRLAAHTLIPARAEDPVRRVLNLPYKPLRDKDGKLAEPKSTFYYMNLIILMSPTPAIMRRILDEKRLLGYQAVQARVPDKALAREFSEVYAPLAGRLGLRRYEDEFRELAFRLEFPDEYERLRQEYERTYGMHYEEAAQRLDALCARIVDDLSDLGITATVNGRQKSIFSMYYKLQRDKESKNPKYRTVADLLDCFGIRIILENPAEQELDVMRRVLAYLHDELGARFNMAELERKRVQREGYNAWHIGFQLRGARMPPIEMQVFTRPDLFIYEHGVPKDPFGSSAHWAYKNWVMSQKTQSVDVYPDLPVDGLFHKDFSALHQYLAERYTYVLRANPDGTLSPVQLSAGAAAQDAAFALGWLDSGYCGIEVAPDATRPEERRTLWDETLDRPGTIVYRAAAGGERLIPARIQQLFANTRSYGARFALYRLLDPVLVRPEFFEKAGFNMLRRFFADRESMDVLLEEAARALGFQNRQQIYLLLGFEKASGNVAMNLVRDVLNFLSVRGMIVLVKDHNINIYDPVIRHQLLKYCALQGTRYDLPRLFRDIAACRIEVQEVVGFVGRIVPGLETVDRTERYVILDAAA